MSDPQRLRMAGTRGRRMDIGGVDARDMDAEEDAWVEDYLDHLCAPLVGVVPLTERRNLRDEVRAHLEAVAEEFGFEGRSRPEATAAALQELGEPWRVGQTFLREWLQGSPRMMPARLTRMAACRAFAFFGVATLPVWGLLEYHAFSLPAFAPSASDLPPRLWLPAALAPLIAGMLTGLSAQPRMGRGLCWAFGLLTIHALLTGALLLPQTEGFGFALWLVLWGLPTGWLSATATAYLVRSHRRQRFLKYAL